MPACHAIRAKGSNKPSHREPDRHNVISTLHHIFFRRHRQGSVRQRCSCSCCCCGSGAQGTGKELHTLCVRASDTCSPCEPQAADRRRQRALPQNQTHPSISLSFPACFRQETERACVCVSVVRIGRRQCSTLRRAGLQKLAEKMAREAARNSDGGSLASRLQERITGMREHAVPPSLTHSHTPPVACRGPKFTSGI